MRGRWRRNVTGRGSEGRRRRRRRRRRRNVAGIGSEVRRRRGEFREKEGEGVSRGGGRGSFERRKKGTLFSSIAENAGQNEEEKEFPVLIITSSSS